MKPNADSELMENTMIFDDGTVIFFDEHRMSRDERDELDYSIWYLDCIQQEYGTLDIYDLMDANLPKKKMFKYLCAIRVIHKHGLDKEQPDA